MVAKNEMEHAASIVKAIMAGEWTNEVPSWAIISDQLASEMLTDDDESNHLRAVWTAEAFILFFQAFNPRFDVSRFLVACGLQDAPTAKRRTR